MYSLFSLAWIISKWQKLVGLVFPGWFDIIVSWCGRETAPDLT